MRTGSTPAIRSLQCVVLFALAAFCMSPSVLGQARPAASSGPALSRIDIFAGYGTFRPFNSDIGNFPYPPVRVGAVGSVADYFTPHFGIQAEGEYSPNGSADNNCAYTAQAGPIIRYQKAGLTPFFHALGGGAIAGGPRTQGCNVWGWGVTGGFGLDVVSPVFQNHLSIRPIQGDFLYSHINNGPQVGLTQGGLGEVYAYRLSAGLVFRFGDMKMTSREVAAFNCSADPANPFPGDPVTLTVSTLTLNPRHNPKILWNSSAGKIAGSGSTAMLDTSTLPPGTYLVNGKLVEGDKQNLVASCSASFTVRQFEQPTVACQASPSTINSGDTVTITTVANSPQNRPLTYTYTSLSGVVSGNGRTATLNTAGVSPGNLSVTCMVADDKGHSVSATAAISIATPPPAPPSTVAALPQARNLCSIRFDRDTRRPDRVDNEAKGCLDQVALALNRETADKLVLVGSQISTETNRNAAERAMNAAQYLTQEKGIDPSRLDLRIGPDSSRSVAMMLLPPGAIVDPADTSFDTSSIPRTGRPYGMPRTKAAPHRAATRRKKSKTAPPRS